jgi:hypothetical protein
VLEKAYSLDQTNLYVLMDLAKTHRFAGGEEKALFFYQKALQLIEVEKQKDQFGLDLQIVRISVR